MNDKFDTVYRQKMGKSDLTFDFGLWAAIVSPPRGSVDPNHLHPRLLLSSRAQMVRTYLGFDAHDNDSTNVPWESMDWWEAVEIHYNLVRIIII